MDWFAKVFIRASLIWFVAGITLGLAMAIHPAWVVYRPAHAHMNLVGFVVMMIFGVGYQMLPRFSAIPFTAARGQLRTSGSPTSGSREWWPDFFSRRALVMQVFRSPRLEDCCGRSARMGLFTTCGAPSMQPSAVAV